MEVPANPSMGWFLGILITAIVSMAGLIAFIVRYYLQNYVPKSTYDQIVACLKEQEERCRNCDMVRSEKLEQIYKILGEIANMNSILSQSLAAINNSLQLILIKNGGFSRGKEGIRGTDVETFSERRGSEKSG